MRQLVTMYSQLEIYEREQGRQGEIGVGVVGEGEETPTQRKERVLQGLRVRVLLGLLHRRPSGKRRPRKSMEEKSLNDFKI